MHMLKMKKAFKKCCFNQLIAFGLISTALGLSHEPTMHFNATTLSHEDKDHNVSMVDTIQVCYQTDDNNVLEESCITSKYIIVPYRFSKKNNTNWMKRVWRRTIPLLNWKDNHLDRAMFFALKPQSDIIHVPEFSGKVLLGNSTPVFKFTLDTYQKIIGDSVMFFVDSQNVDEITCINSKCFHKNGECKDRICSCSCNYNMFKLTYYTDIVCEKCTFGMEWRFQNREKGSIFKQYLSRAYDSTGFGNLESHSEILRGAYQDEIIDVSAAKDSPFRHFKICGLVFLTFAIVVVVLPLLSLIIYRYIFKTYTRGQRKRTRRYPSCVFKLHTTSTYCSVCDVYHEYLNESINLMTEAENFNLFDEWTKDEIRDKEVEFDPDKMAVVLEMSNRRQGQRTTQIHSFASKSQTANKNDYVYDIDFENQDESINFMTEQDYVEPFNQFSKDELRHIAKEDVEPSNQLSKDELRDKAEEVNPARMSGLRQKSNRRQRRRTRTFQSCVSKSQTANTNNYMCYIGFENQEKSLNLMAEQNNVEPFNQLSKDELRDKAEEDVKPSNKLNKDDEVEDLTPLNKLSKDKIKDKEQEKEEFATQPRIYLKTKTSYEHGKQQYEQKRNSPRSFDSTETYEHGIMVKTNDNQGIDYKVKKLTNGTKSCQQGMEEFARTRIQIKNLIASLQTALDVLQSKENAFEIERNALSPVRKMAQKLHQKPISELNQHDNTLHELQLKQNNKTRQG